MQLQLEVVLLGTGGSDQTPHLACTLALVKPCQACLAAETRGGRKSRRRQASALLKIIDPADASARRNILIDCGRSFPDCVELLRKHGVKRLDAILLTHDHADATLGLPFLRPWTKGGRQDSVKIYATAYTKTAVLQSFPWLAPNQKGGLGGEAKLSFEPLPDLGTIDLFGVRVDVFPIRHGGTSEAPYNASGFLFNQQIGYLSDLTDMADSSWAVLEKARNLQLRDSGRGLPLLVVDCFKMQSSPWHSGIGVNFERAARLRCQRTIFTQVGHGLSHAQLTACCKRIQRSLRGKDIEEAAALTDRLDAHHSTSVTSDKTTLEPNSLAASEFYHRELGIHDKDTKSLVLLALGEVLDRQPEYRGGILARPGFDGQVLRVPKQGRGEKRGLQARVNSWLYSIKAIGCGD